MLNPKSNIGCQSPIIFWDCAFNLQPQIACYLKVEPTVSDGGKAQNLIIRNTAASETAGNSGTTLSK